MIAASSSIAKCRQAYAFAVTNGLENTQVFMDWQDALNQISVAYPNIVDITDLQDTEQTNNNDVNNG